MRFFGFRRKNKEGKSDDTIYVSTLQKDVGKYQGWSRADVEKDFCARKSVHTILTIGYLRYEDEVLVLTEKGHRLMRNVTEEA